MLFFVLSGFCIHLPVARKGKAPNWAAYAVRRLVRIYPAYLITIILCLLAAILLHGGVLSESKLYVASAAMLQNWTYGGTQISMNPSLWSIPIEVEFYLAYPVLLAISQRLGLCSAIIFTLSCTALGITLSVVDSSLAGVTFFKYALIWNAGAWLADLYAKGQLPQWTHWHLLAMVASAGGTMIAGLSNINVFYLHYGWALFSTLLLLWVLGPGARYFSLHTPWIPPLVFTGTVSYSLYLLHFPVFKLSGAAWIWLTGAKPESFLIPTLATLMMIPLAWVFYRLVELPTHRFAQRWGSLIQEKN
jgi:peptidoglycan/LPS O-acetylase OafA/YrhL